MPRTITIGAALLAVVALALGALCAFRLGQRAGKTSARREVLAARTMHAVLAATVGRHDLRAILATILERMTNGLEAASGLVSLSDAAGSLRLVHAVGVEDAAPLGVIEPDDALIRQLAASGTPHIMEEVAPESTWAALAGHGLQRTLAIVPFGATPRQYGVFALAWPGRQRAEAAADTLQQAATVAGQVVSRFGPLEQREHEFKLAMDGLHHLQTISASLAHDIGNGLTVLTLLLDLQMETGSLDERRVAREMLAYLEIAKSLREDLMNLGRRRLLEPERVAPCLIAELVQGMAHRYLARAGLTFMTGVADDLPDMWVERVGLIRILDNLLQNAARYNRPGGQVWLRARHAGAWIEWEVGDTGVGIPTEALPHLFDYGYRAPGQDSRPVGLGIGLWSSRQIVEAHGGRIWAASTPEGSRFFFTVPVAPAGECYVSSARCHVAHDT